MPALPIPIIVSLILAFLFLRSLARGESRPLLLALIATCAVQLLIVAMVHHYGVASLRPVMPVTATLVPMLAWLAFVSGASRPLSWQRDSWHVLAPLFLLVCVGFAPALVDIAIPSMFAAYGAAILLVTASGGDSLPRTHLESGDMPARLWRVFAGLLIVSALSDVIIVADQWFGSGNSKSLIVAAFSSLNLLVLGIVSLSRDLGGSPEAAGAGNDIEQKPAGADTDAADPRLDAELMARLDQLMQDRKPYLDPNLTLAQMARKLTVPAKQVSAAINRSTGGNVSRHVNNYRIEHACTLIAEGRSITSAMLDSGFNTKSNFNREFLRAKGHNPSEWARRRTGVAPVA